MKECVAHLMNCIDFGEMQTHEHISLMPLHSQFDGSVDYLTLSEALEDERVIISEISEAGSVPELKVQSQSDKPILLLDGEELSGGRQNRVLNTSILIPENKELTVPVTCTEEGRWGYTSTHFADSGILMHHSSRSRRHRSVSDSLHTHGTYASDQAEAWAGIHGLHMDMGTHSPTSAMKDAYLQQKETLKKCLEAFGLEEGQTGLLVMVNGEVMGFDIVSSPNAYKKLHDRLVKSYVMDGLVTKKHSQLDSEYEDRAREFLATTGKCKESRFDSIGYGSDYRYRSECTLGSSLVNEDQVIHAAFFRDDPSHARHPGLSRRRHYRDMRSTAADEQE